MGRPPSYDRATALNTAMKLFWKQGYQGTSLKDLENALSMRPGSIYAAFHSKEALYRECIEVYSTDMLRSLEDLSKANQDPVDALKACLLYFAGLSGADQESHCMLVKALLEAAEDSKGQVMFDTVSKEKLAKVQAIITDCVRRGQQSGAISSSPDHATISRGLFSTAIGLRAQRLVMDESEDTDAALRDDLLTAVERYQSE